MKTKKEFDWVNSISDMTNDSDKLNLESLSDQDLLQLARQSHKRNLSEVTNAAQAELTKRGISFNPLGNPIPQGGWLHRLLGLAPPKLPVTSEEKDWIEESFLWLMNDLGTGLLSSPIILPTAEFFPDPYAGQREDVMPMLVRLCEYMSVDPDTLKLEFYSESRDDYLRTLPFYEGQKVGSAGHYRIRKGKQIIGIETSQLSNTTSLVATLAHELGHAILLGEDRLSSTEDDHEPLTDLLTVYYGLGIFSANSAFQFSQFESGGYQGWRAQTNGYLSEQMFGYALAVYAWIRGETKPAWYKYLDDGVKVYCQNSLKYLEMTNDSLLIKGMVSDDFADDD